MAKSYHTITSATTTVLKAITKPHAGAGAINKIRLTNSHASTAVTIELFIYATGPVKYVLAHQDIPARSSVILKDNLTYDAEVYDLRLTTVSAAIDASNPLTVIIA